jgi:3-isopropylmalate/(R)-2-methylmalate dehydratase small subunit
MEKFTKLTGVAAPFPMRNVDTDMIIPKQFLKTIKRTGLGKALFYELRYDQSGKENADFVLNKPAYRNAEILVAGENFGCGSSREHAPWALADYGFRAILAPSFADIFFNNCFKNGLLPVVLPDMDISELQRRAQANAGYQLTINLESCTVTDDQGFSRRFQIDEFRRHCLLNGLDDIGLSLQHEADITAFEQRRAQRGW